ncbi:nicotinate-nucleotide--dimethylbenzimidazole phosphoribosyltransferase [Parvibaculum sp.]|uniref:nicotinate-nucleotide--dimethylbenzimidazole phosphoribosyltransferase n=1 Tax=Parvibaculum sp. TaxID=2024848 RepID=UPI00320E88DB
MTRPPSGLPFDDIRDLIAGLPAGDDVATVTAAAHAGDLVDAGGLGRLEEIAVWLARWQANPKPAVERPLVAIFAANHRVASRVSDLPQARTRQMVELFAAGGAAVNQFALAANAGLKVFDLALDMPVPDITGADALSEQACAATMAFGMEAIAGGTDLLCVGAAGVGNGAVAAALAAALFGGEASDWTSDPREQAVVEEALAFHGNALRDPLEALRRLGGRELAAIAGAILAARYQRIPVLLDGFVACAAAAVLYRQDQGSLDHCLAAHRSGSVPHDILLEALGKEPLLDLGLTLEDGTGAALAVNLVRSAAGALSGMATREQAGFA